MLIRTKGKTYKAKDLTAAQRVESLADRNYKPTGDRETDRQTERNIEQAIKLAKNES